jgi:O-antigen/teichoic acid export membrane protein
VTDTQASRTPRLLVVGAGYVAVAMSFLNVASYLFTALAARSVVPSVFGEVTALMGILLVGSVAALGLQTTTARRLAVSRDAAERAQLVIAARRSGLQIGLGASLMLLALSPVLVPVLALEAWAPGALVALTLLPLCLFGAEAGVAQGSGSWGHLAGLYVASGLGRLVFGTAGALLLPTATGVLLGVLVGACLPVLLGWSLLRASAARRPARRVATSGPAAERAVGAEVLRETMHGAHALLAFFAVTNADAVLARIVLSEHDSGLYGAGLIVAKATLFLPQFVAVVAFPALARSESPATRRIATLTVAGLGAAAALGTWLLPQLALVFAGGERYADVQGLLPLFAVEGAVFALVNLLVYDALAAESRGVIVLLWLILAAVVTFALLAVDTRTGLVLTMIVAGVCASTGRLVSRRGAGASAPAQ